MHNKAMKISENELLGQLLDGKLTIENLPLLLKLENPQFREFFMLALRVYNLSNLKLQ